MKEAVKCDGDPLYIMRYILYDSTTKIHDKSKFQN